MGIAQWFNNHIVYKVLPKYFKYPPGTVHSYYAWLLCLLFPMLYSPVTILELPINAS